mmetsp:Transcript_1369/g.1937  ORF Transcript_1369/g.1937 Transcript_1369/m.1937 type:complete len:334 (-) Transcript_1369:85-1086(-)
MLLKLGGGGGGGGDGAGNDEGANAKAIAATRTPPQQPGTKQPQQKTDGGDAKDPTPSKVTYRLSGDYISGDQETESGKEEFSIELYESSLQPVPPLKGSFDKTKQELSVEFPSGWEYSGKWSETRWEGKMRQSGGPWAKVFYYSILRVEAKVPSMSNESRSNAKNDDGKKQKLKKVSFPTAKEKGSVGAPPSAIETPPAQPGTLTLEAEGKVEEGAAEDDSKGQGVEAEGDSAVGEKEQKKKLTSSPRNDENKEKGREEVEIGDAETSSPTASKPTTWYSGAEIIALVRGAFNKRDRYEEGVVIEKLREVLSTHIIKPQKKKVDDTPKRLTSS